MVTHTRAGPPWTPLSATRVIRCRRVEELHFLEVHLGLQLAQHDVVDDAFGFAAAVMARRCGRAPRDDPANQLVALARS